MSSLQQVQIPEDGLLILFTPKQPGSYQAQMAFSPGDMEAEDIKFYVALGQGLMHVATKNTDEVTSIGVQIIEALELVKDENNSSIESEIEILNDEQDDIPGMIN